MLKRIIITSIAALVVLSVGSLRSAEKTSTIKGYVLDSACAYVKNLDKPISPDCAVACAKAGSPLVILAEDGNIYLPISKEMPAKGQNEKLMKWAGQKVAVTGTIYQKGSSHAIAVEKIEAAGFAK